MNTLRIKPFLILTIVSLFSAVLEFSSISAIYLIFSNDPKDFEAFQNLVSKLGYAEEIGVFAAICLVAALLIAANFLRLQLFGCNSSVEYSSHHGNLVAQKTFEEELSGF